MRVGGGGRCGEWRGAGANAAFPRFNNARPACADESRGERGGFCMGFVPASSRDRLTWTGNESRGIGRPAAHQRRKIATHAGGFLPNRPRVQKHNLCSRILPTVIRHTDTYVFHSYGISEGKGSVAQLVVRQIPALKARGSSPLWVTLFSLIFLKMIFRRLITYWQSQ